MTTTNIAEVLKLAAKPVQYDNDEKTWLEFRFKLENYPTLVDERYVALLPNAESQPVANLPTGTEESAVTIRTLSHTLYALLATLTTGRSLRLVQRVPNRNGFEAWRQMAAENAPKTARRRFAMLQAVCYSREWVIIRQSLRKRGSRGNVRWTSTKISPQQSWTMT